MKKILLGIIVISNFSLANEILIQKAGYSTYIQEEEFMVAEGENVIGPVFLLPIAKLSGLVVEGENLKIDSFIIEGDNKNWKDTLKGQIVSIEGEGRFIKGAVVEITDNRIMLDTRKGYVVTTLPKFPSRLSSSQNWHELFSPKITFKLSAKEAKTEKFKFIYPVLGISWQAEYILYKTDKKETFQGYITLLNKTPLSLRNVKAKLYENKKIIKEINETTLPSFSKKKILFIKDDMKNINLSSLPSGVIAVYENGVFVGFKKLKNGSLK
ncbi:MAG: hypothetical protein GXO21_04600 [Aquificae bacterium]|nr:hypothetical protein [Aquificota bacterium]